MSRKIKDTSPRFALNKNYAIGALQANSSPSDIPARFSQHPVKALHLSGGDLVSGGMRTARDFLQSANCHFRQGTSVHFFDVVYGEDEPKYTHIFTGTPLLQPQAANLGDNMASTQQPIENRIIIPPNDRPSESEKMWLKSQTERIGYLEKLLTSKESEFSKERSGYIGKINELNDKILDLNILSNTCNAEKTALTIRLEENKSFIERLSAMQHKEEVEEVPGLADRGIAMIDGFLGDGAGSQLVNGLAEGLGNGVGKLVDLGISLASKKLNLNQTQVSQTQQIQAPPIPAIKEPTAENEQLQKILEGQ